MLRLYVRLLVKWPFCPRPVRPKRSIPRFRPMLERLETRLTPSTVDWIGGSGDWSNANNWLDATTMTNHVPGAADDAVINVAGITVTHSTGTDSVNSLTSSDAFVLSGGSLSVASASAINNTFTESNGTLGGAGDLSVSSLLTWTGGTMSDTGATNANGGLSVSGTGVHVLIGRLLDINAGATLTSSLHTGSGAIITNAADSTFDIQNDSGIFHSGGATSSLVNQGTLQKSGGTGTSTIGIALSNSGTVSVLAGTLNFIGNFSNFTDTTLTGGTYFVSGTLQFANANIQTNAANIVLDGTASQIVNQNGVDALTNFANNTGSFTVQNGRSFTTASDFENDGTLTVGAGSAFNVSGNFTQGSSSTLEMQLGGSPSSGGPFGQMAVTGTATFAGTLTATLVNGYVPTTGDTFPIVTYASRSGDFTSGPPQFNRVYDDVDGILNLVAQ